jgi:hypothetical protein
MAMAAGLVTEFADVDLKDRDACRAERETTGLEEAQVERWGDSRLIEDAKLFSR